MSIICFFYVQRNLYVLNQNSFRQNVNVFCRCRKSECLTQN